MRFTLACGLVWLVSLQLALAASPAAPSYAEIVQGDKPVAYWRLNEPQGTSVANVAVRAGQASTLEGKLTAARLGQPGPDMERYPDFESGNLAAGFNGHGSRIEIDDPGAESPLDFKLGDSITLEAWVSLNRIQEGHQIYVVGKGRTGNKGFAADNQNYALRLRGTPDGGTSMAAVSFLFRDADNGSKSDGQADKDWHRWTTHGGFVEGSGWHHIAVSYTFGKAKSIKGYIDGVEVEGVWDMGGASDEAPVVDDDQVWIGSSMGGNSGSSFDGLIDEVAIYRTALSSERLRSHYRANITEQVVAPIEVKPGEVLVQILEGLPDKHSWEFAPPRVTEQYVEQAFGLPDVPKKYSRKALVIDRSSPFLVRASGDLALPEGKYRLLLRSRGAARLFVDGKLVLETPFPKPNGSGHEDVPELPTADEPELRQLQVGHSEDLKPIELDGQSHEFRLECLVGGRKLRPELGEFAVSIAKEGEPFRLLSSSRTISMSDAGWLAYVAEQRQRLATMNQQARAKAGEEETEYWQQRHELARRLWQKRAAEAKSALGQSKDSAGELSPIDRIIGARLAEVKLEAAPLVDDATFLKRLSLDTVGVIPTRQELEAFLGDTSPDRRRKAIDRLLDDPRWADHWVGYWQDVLAENPGLLKPQLNNTGPFRWWIYESFLDNKPIDRFVTELVMMEGSRLSGGPAGFAMATQNDSPMAAKANIVAQAFLGMEMQCARCHDAPYHPVKQEDTFSLAAMLNKSPLKVPLTSTVKFAEGARKPLVEVTLKPGSEVKPDWPFDALVSPELPDGVLRSANDPRERLAAILTGPQNERFPQVMANRLWKRYLGRGLVEPVDDWSHAEPSHPALLDYLASELATHGYDLKHLARLIFSSQTYQRQVQQTESDTDLAALFATPSRRRLSAEQLVDSLFLSVGKEFRSEELNLDPDGRRPQADFLNLGNPRRAWQFTSLSNERDRPALALPVAQSIVDVLITFGWRQSRQNPITQREMEPTVLQPLVLANGVVGSRITRLSDDSAVTALALEERPLPELVQAVFRQILSREATTSEEQMFVELLADGYDQRVISSPGVGPKVASKRRTAVSWSNHLSPEATRIKLEMERAARAGDPPTDRLRADWRQRMEDMLWALVNSPEFAFVP